MKLSQQSISLIEGAIKKAITGFMPDSGNSFVTDIHFLPDSKSGELIILDDEDNELATTTIEEWTNFKQENFYEEVEQALSSILKKLNSTESFDKLTILKPYSFILVDEDKETISELLLMDDDMLLINDELLKGLDEELDSFLKDLLEKSYFPQ